MDIFLRKKPGGFEPVFDTDIENLKRIKIGEEVKCSITKPRNYKFHQKFFALLQLAFRNQDRYQKFDHLRIVYTLKAGYYEEIRTDYGTHYHPKSISFAKMDQTEFEDLFNKMVDVVVMEIGVDRKELIQEVEDFIRRKAN